MLTSIFIKAQLLLPQVFLFGANKSTILKKNWGLNKGCFRFFNSNLHTDFSRCGHLLYVW
ncbi:hypothetical protein AA109_14650 [Listeria monocytogenes]|nr:hypothetical protein AA109_14650 [Listeria monocytogenes]